MATVVDLCDEAEPEVTRQMADTHPDWAIAAQFCDECAVLIPATQVEMHLRMHARKRRASIIPCELCHASVPFADFADHIAACTGTDVGKRLRGEAHTSRRGREADILSSSVSSSCPVIDVEPHVEDRNVQPRCLQNVPEPEIECERCSTKILFSEFQRHMKTHALEDAASTRPKEPDIQCESCGQIVPFREFKHHMDHHESEDRAAKARKQFEVECEHCGLKVPSAELQDHVNAHKLEEKERRDAEQREESDLGEGTAEAIAFRVVQLLRERGQGLPGNRSQRSFSIGEHVQALWQDDGRWYRASVSGDNGDGTYALAWSAPYQSWEKALRQKAEEIVSLQGAQTQEVVNFDVCVRFVLRMLELAKASGKETVSLIPEIVYHWTPCQNHSSIIEDSLLVPGVDRSASSGSTIQVANGEALGKGIYTSTDPRFGISYGQGAQGAFLCLGLPGRHIAYAQGRVHKATKCKTGKLPYDSLTNGTVRVYTSSDLLLPCFITDIAQADALCKILLDVSDLLLDKVVKPSAFTLGDNFFVGQRVEALWQGEWWPARVLSKCVVPGRGKGFTVAWAPPHEGWPHMKALEKDVRPPRSGAASSTG